MDAAQALDMTKAIEGWLVARDEWLTHTGELRLTNFKKATSLLYAAFLQEMDMVNSVCAPDAFYQFRKLLTQQHDRGIPSRQRYHKNPVVCGHA
jgi:hypothetical protein